MRHIMLNSSFTFETGVVPGFRHLYFNVTDSILIPVNGIEPVAFYQVILNNASREIIHRTGDLSDAGTCMNAYNDDPNHECTRASVRVIWALPENQFRVIQSVDRDGVVAVLSGEDFTQRALAFIGCDGSPSRVDLDRDKSAAVILKESCDPNSDHRTVEVISVMDVGQRLIFTLSEPDKPNNRQLRIYTWTGRDIAIETIPEYQWSAYLTRELMDHHGSIPKNWNPV